MKKSFLVCFLILFLSACNKKWVFGVERPVRVTSVAAAGEWDATPGLSLQNVTFQCRFPTRSASCLNPFRLKTLNSCVGLNGACNTNKSLGWSEYTFFMIALNGSILAVNIGRTSNSMTFLSSGFNGVSPIKYEWLLFLL